jgi:predicted nuclease with TOPRIM domain
MSDIFDTDIGAGYLQKDALEIVGLIAGGVENLEGVIFRDGCVVMTLKGHQDLKDRIAELETELSHENDLFLEMREQKEQLEADLGKYQTQIDSIDKELTERIESERFAFEKLGDAELRILELEQPK